MSTGDSTASRTNGAIKVEGNQSAGIAVDGALNGTLYNSGTIGVIGNDSFGIHTGAINGDVRITNGSITTQGGNSVGVMLGGDVSGVVQSRGR